MSPASRPAQRPRRRRRQARSQIPPAHGFTFPAGKYCRGRAKNKMEMNEESSVQTCLLLPFKQGQKAAWKGKAEPEVLGSIEGAMPTCWQHSGELAKRDLRLGPGAHRACQLPLKPIMSSDVTKALKDRSSANLSSSHPAELKALTPWHHIASPTHTC